MEKPKKEGLYIPRDCILFLEKIAINEIKIEKVVSIPIEVRTHLADNTGEQEAISIAIKKGQAQIAGFSVSRFMKELEKRGYIF